MEKKIISIGKQDFAWLRENDCFYVDKTNMIREWWESKDDVTGGYLKVDEVEYRGITREPWYHLTITNLETLSIFYTMFKGWFRNVSSSYNAFEGKKVLIGKEVSD